MKVYKSKVSRSIHRTAVDLYQGGLIDEERMRGFDESCLVPSISPDEIRSFREREALSRADLAAELRVSADLVGRWERGKSVPSPQASKLLDLARRKGIDAIR